MDSNFFKKIQSFIPRPLQNKYILTGILFLVWILLLDPVNGIDWMQEQAKLRRLRKEQLQLKQQLDATTRKIESFAYPDSLEKIAREQFYFTGPNEEVFIIEE
jgi:cell division protein FtsB